MSDTKKLWERIGKLPGGNQNPFEIPLGPTKECLTSKQVVAYTEDEVKEPEVVKHLSNCYACTERIRRMNEVIKETQ